MWKFSIMLYLTILVLVILSKFLFLACWHSFILLKLIYLFVKLDWYLRKFFFQARHYICFYSLHIPFLKLKRSLTRKLLPLNTLITAVSMKGDYIYWLLFIFYYVLMRLTFKVFQKFICLVQSIIFTYKVYHICYIKFENHKDFQNFT